LSYNLRSRQPATGSKRRTVTRGLSGRPRTWGTGWPLQALWRHGALAADKAGVSHSRTLRRYGRVFRSIRFSLKGKWSRISGFDL